MIPLFFGPDAHRKYGVFQPALGLGSKGRGIVFCDALYDEALCAHRALRFAAERMAAARWSSLRFDYFGTGDSLGETDEFTLEQALRDTADAIEELKASAGLESVYLLGIRLGGALAAMAAESRPDVRGLMLWDPVIEGEEVLRRYGASDPHGGGERIEGFRLPEAARHALRTVSIEDRLGACGLPLLMVCTSPSAQHRRIAERHDHIDYREIDAPQAWSNTALGGMRPIPAGVVDELLAWEG